jgi:lauroyl/myristoyl acyltransferase
MARVVPGRRLKAAVINGFGTIAGLAAAAIPRKRRQVTASAVKVYGPDAARGFATRYYAQAGRDRAWSYIAAASPAIFSRFIQIDDDSPARRFKDLRTGVVIAGAHYGLIMNRQAMDSLGLSAITLISREVEQILKDEEQMGLVWLKPRLSDPRQIKGKQAVAGSGEIQLTKHLKSGGVVFIQEDLPRTDTSGVPAEICALRTGLNRFAFKLALANGAPVHFVSFRPKPEGGYRWVMTPAVTFSTPEEGVKEYASWLSGLLAESPYLWHGLRFYDENT